MEHNRWAPSATPPPLWFSERVRPGELQKKIVHKKEIIIKMDQDRSSIDLMKYTYNSAFTTIFLGN